MRCWKSKVILCGLLMVFAAVSAVTVLRDVGVISVAAEECAYVLREHEDYVCVFYPEETAPVMVTDIRVRDLPAGDRRQLADGIPAADHREMLTMLEGLSS